MKKEKNYIGYLKPSHTKNLANFETFCWNISLSTNLLYLKSKEYTSKYVVLKQISNN